jgi:hypothetical protein
LIYILFMAKDAGDFKKVFIGHLYFFWKPSVQFICPSIDWIICSLCLIFWVLYIFWILTPWLFTLLPLLCKSLLIWWNLVISCHYFMSY